MINKNSTYQSLDNEILENKCNDLVYALNESSLVSYTDLSGKITNVNNKFCEI